MTPRVVGECPERERDGEPGEQEVHDAVGRGPARPSTLGPVAGGVVPVGVGRAGQADGREAHEAAARTRAATGSGVIVTRTPPPRYGGDGREV